MFYEQDTILRLIAQLGAAFRRVMTLLEDGEAERELDEYCRTLCGLERNVADHMDVDSLCELLPPDRLFALSELTHLRAQRFQHALDTDVLAAIELRALRLLARVDDEEIAQRQIDRMQELRALAEETLTCADQEDIVRFFIRGCAYDRAEDALFHAIDSYPLAEQRQSLLALGRSMYDRLAQLPAQRLVLGGLPPDEVREGQRAIERIISKKDWNA